MKDINIKSAFIRKRNENYNVYIEYTDDTGKTKQKSEGKYKTRKEAEKHLIDLKSSINNNRFIISKDITFVDRFKYYMYDPVKNLAPYTVRRMESMLRVNIEPFFNDLKLKDVTPVILQSFLNNIFSKYTQAGARPKAASIKAVLNEAYRLKEIPENPCDFVKNPQSLRKGIVTDPFDSEETRLVVKKLNGTNIEMPILLMLTMGLRVGEACGLRWEDIDFKNNTISINQGLIYTKSTGVAFKEPKTKGSIRTLSAPPELMSKLKKLKTKHNEYKLLNILESDNLVCLNIHLKPYIPSVLARTWSRWCIRENIRHISLHDLRHTHATILVLSGTDFKTISDRLGHTDIKITLNRYSHVLKEMDKKASDNISNMMFN